MQPLSIAIAQLNPTVGDLAGNAEKIIQAYREAAGKGGTLVVCPELCLIGYPPEDIVLSPSFVSAAMAKAREVAAQTTPTTALIFGSLWEEKGALYNAAIFAAEGRIQQLQYKTMLPNYGVFDEKRIFTAGSGSKIIEWGGKRLALLICEDMWYTDRAGALAKQAPDYVIAINASPFEIGKLAQRKRVVATFAQAAQTPVIYVNMVGGQDDIVFDGASFATDKKGYVTWQAPGFEECVVVHGESCMAHGQDAAKTKHDAPGTMHHDIWSAMKLGLADYLRKNGFSKVLLGLSGGIDSAVSAVCAVDALGADNVRGVLLPSPYTSPASIDDALVLAKNLGIATDMIPITPAMEIYQNMLEAVFAKINPPAKDSGLVMVDWIQDLAVGGNLQARIRGQILMALSNKTGALLLSTGNKSEVAVGYTTLYGDACGGYNVLKDVYKTQVYALAQWRNQWTVDGGQWAINPIPLNSITRAPSAELTPNQKDSDQLPEYEVLDVILEQHIEGRKSAAEITVMGFDKATVERVLTMVRQSEYKRRQSCPGVKISPMMFGRDRRFPLTNKG